MTNLTDRSLKIRFALLNAAFCAACCILTYQNVYLIEQGYSSVEIGLATSVAGVIGAVILPAFGMLSDKIGSSKRIYLLTMIICGGMMGVLPVFIPLIRPLVIPMCLYIGIGNIMKMPAATLMDAWSVSELAPRGIPYGGVRMWGSVAAAAVSFPLGMIVGNVIPTAAVMWLILLFVGLIVVICLKLPTGRTAEKGRLNLRAIFANRLFLAYLVYTLALNLYSCVTVGYFAYILEAAGCQASQAGLLYGIRAAAEIIIMYLSVRLVSRFPRGPLMIGAGVLCILENFLYQTAGSLAALLAIVGLSGIGGGIFYGIGPDYVHEIVPEDIQYTAQSLIGVSTQVTTIAGSFVGGLLIHRFGVFAMTNSFGVFSVILTAMFAASIVLGHDKR